MKKFLIITLTVLIVALVGTGIYAYSLLNGITRTSLAESTPEDLGISDSAPKEEDTGVVNVLLFGIDRRDPNEKGSRSDAIMIATVDKKHQKLKLTSLMRDMYVSIPGKPDHKLNSAYAFGGPALAIKTVNTNFDLNIKRYATVDFFGLENIIDTLGGVEIDVKKGEVKYINQYLDELNSIDQSGKKSPYVTDAGLQTLDGKQAVAYCRIRYVGRDDFERTERQRRVLAQLFEKAKDINVTDAPKLASAIFPYVETNMTNTEIITLGTAVLGFKDKTIYQYRIPADGTFTSPTIKKMSVLVPDFDANKKLLHEFLYNSDGNIDDEVVENILKSVPKTTNTSDSSNKASPSKATNTTDNNKKNNNTAKPKSKPKDDTTQTTTTTKPKDGGQPKNDNVPPKTEEKPPSEPTQPEEQDNNEGNKSQDGETTPPDQEQNPKDEGENNPPAENTPSTDSRPVDKNPVSTSTDENTAA